VNVKGSIRFVIQYHLEPFLIHSLL